MNAQNTCVILSICAAASVFAALSITITKSIRASPSLEHTRPKLPGVPVEEVKKVKNDWVAIQVHASHIGAVGQGVSDFYICLLVRLRHHFLSKILMPWYYLLWLNCLYHTPKAFAFNNAVGLQIKQAIDFVFVLFLPIKNWLAVGGWWPTM